MPRQGGDGHILDEFLDYVANGEVSGALPATLDDAVSKALDNEQWRVEYMMLEVRDQLNYDKGVLKGRETGRIEGEAAGREADRAEGEAHLSSLLAHFLAAGRSSDIERVLSDSQSHEEAYAEFGI